MDLLGLRHIIYAPVAKPLVMSPSFKDLAIAFHAVKQAVMITSIAGANALIFWSRSR
jgi:hypothetical protein